MRNPSTKGILVDYSKFRMLYEKEEGIYKQFQLSLIYRLMFAFISQIFISDMLMEYSNYFINNRLLKSYSILLFRAKCYLLLAKGSRVEDHFR